MIIVSMSVQNHDASLCILKDGEVILLIQEERACRIKHSSNFPLKMLEYIPIYAEHIDYLCIGEELTRREQKSIYDFLSLNKIKVNDSIIFDNEHHLYHASSAFYGSGYEESVCLVIDGWGRAFTDEKNSLYSVETTSIYHATYPNKFTPIYKRLWYNPMMGGPYPDFINSFKKKFNYKVDLSPHFDIGVMYSVVTEHLGYESGCDEGKVMGLSAYGKPNKKIPNLLCENSILCNKNLFLSNRTLNEDLYGFLTDMNFQEKADLAFALQKSLEKIFLDRVKYAVEKTNCNNIVFSGGCALNVVGNYEIKKAFPEINFYIDPIANDACQSFGIAKYFYHKLTNYNKPIPLKNLYLGVDHKVFENKEKIKDIIKKYNGNDFSYN